MLKSMTGYGKSECQLPSKKLTIEIKSLNSKNMDTSLRLPAIYREKELDIRQLITARLERGKIECTLHYEIVEGVPSTLNKEVIKNYLQELKDITTEENIDQGDILSTVLRLPDTIIAERTTLEEKEWAEVEKTILEALDEVNEFRVQEGNALMQDLENRIAVIKTRFDEVAPFEAERIERIKDRILQNLKEINPDVEPDPNRFEQELIYYAEKLDINEEKVRLKNHLEYFMEVLKNGSPNGKKLGFICQEIGREINTLGSKANHQEIQRLVVDMKDELEKIKEQVLNVL